MVVCDYVVGVILASPEQFSITWTTLSVASPMTGLSMIQFLLDLVGYPVYDDRSIFTEVISRSSCPSPKSGG